MGEYQSVVVLRETHNLGIRMQGAGNTVIPRLSEHLWPGRATRAIILASVQPNQVNHIISYPFKKNTNIENKNTEISTS